MKLITGLNVLDSDFGGIAIIDLDLGEYDCLYFHELPTSFESIGFRGISCLEDKIYVVSPTALFIFEFCPNKEGAAFKLYKEVYRPEWRLGKPGIWGNLLDVHCCVHRQRVYVTSGSTDKIYVFSLQGKFIEYFYAWDVVKGLISDYSNPGRPDRGYTWATHVGAGPDQTLWVTLGDVQGTGQGLIANLESGEILIGGLSCAMDGLVDNNKVFVTDFCSSSAFAYEMHRESNNKIVINSEPLCAYLPEIHDENMKQSRQRMRGLLAEKGKLIAGVSAWKAPGIDQIGSRLCIFDQISGDLEKEIILPQVKQYSWLSVYSLCSVPYSWLDRLPLPKRQRLYLPENINTSILHIDQSEMRSSRKRDSKDENSDPNIDSERQEDKESGALKKSTCSIELAPEEQIENNEKKKIVISLEEVTLSYPKSEPSLKSLVRFNNSKGRFWALKGLNITVYEGEIVGLIGRNGSGKSTTVKLIGGIYSPDNGTIKVNGKVSILSLRSGFKIHLSGRDNVYLRGAYLGLTRAKIQRHMEEIVEFAEIKDFIDEPVRHYSSGMRARLAFAINAVLQPEILIIDEALSTGDSSFREKVTQRVTRLVDEARAVLIVSHQMGFLKEVCTKIVWMEKGRKVMEGDPSKIISKYLNFCRNPFAGDITNLSDDQ